MMLGLILEMILGSVQKGKGNCNGYGGGACKVNADVRERT